MDNATFFSLARRIVRKREGECPDEEYFLAVLQIWNKMRQESVEELVSIYAHALYDQPGEWGEHISQSRLDYLAWETLQELLSMVRPHLDNPEVSPECRVALDKLRDWALDVAQGLRPHPPSPGGEDRVLRTRDAAIVVTLRRLKDLGINIGTSNTNRADREATGFYKVGKVVGLGYEGVRKVWKKKSILDTESMYQTIESLVAARCELYVRLFGPVHFGRLEQKVRDGIRAHHQAMARRARDSSQRSPTKDHPDKLA